MFIHSRATNCLLTGQGVAKVQWTYQLVLLGHLRTPWDNPFWLMIIGDDTIKYIDCHNP